MNKRIHLTILFININTVKTKWRMLYYAVIWYEETKFYCSLIRFEYREKKNKYYVFELFNIWVCLNCSTTCFIQRITNCICFTCKARLVITFNFEQLHIMSLAINFAIVRGEITGPINKLKSAFAFKSHSELSGNKNTTYFNTNLQCVHRKHGLW